MFSGRPLVATPIARNLKVSKATAEVCSSLAYMWQMNVGRKSHIHLHIFDQEATWFRNPLSNRY